MKKSLTLFLLGFLCLFLNELQAKNIYVNDGSATGDVYTTNVGSLTGTGSISNPYLTLSRAKDDAVNGDVILIDAGDYTEQVIMSGSVIKNLTIQGAGNGKTVFHLPTIFAKVSFPLQSVGISPAILYYHYSVIHAQDFDNFRVKDLVVDGGNINVSDISVPYAPIKSLYAISIQRSSGSVSGCEIRNFKNYNPSAPSASNGFGVIAINFQATLRNVEIYNNTFTNLYKSAVLTQGPTITTNIHDNVIEANGSSQVGQYAIHFWGGNGIASKNTIRNIAEYTVNANEESAAVLVEGASANVEIASNTISNAEVGIMLAGGPYIRVDNNEISGSVVSGIASYAVGTLGTPADIYNNKITNSANGIYATNLNSPAQPSVKTASITGNYFADITNEYIRVENTTVDASCNWLGSTDPETIASKITGTRSYSPWLISATDDDISLVGFQTSIDRCSGRQTKYYVNDNSAVGDTYTTAVGNDNNMGFASSPFLTITRAMAVAQEGDEIYIDAGSYTEQVKVGKSITLQGAGKDLTKIIEPNQGAITPVLPSNDDMVFNDLLQQMVPFNETGIIQSELGIGDVIIRDLSVVGSGSFSAQNGILIRGGGNVENCEITGTNNGIYFREPTSIHRNANVLNNKIENIQYVGINFEGVDMNSNAIGNSILYGDNQLSGMAIIAGFDFGSTYSLTVANNLISGFNGWGVACNTSSTYLNDNSIEGTGPYLKNTSEVPAYLTCNWFGTKDRSEINAQIEGPVNLGSVLVDGTNESGATGFASAAGTCTSEQDIYYVNDSNLDGDVYTSSVGDDNNPGSAQFPLATISKALELATEGQTIYVDAGDYSEQITITKGITILGAGKSLTKIYEPETITQLPDLITYSPIKHYSGIIQSTMLSEGITIKDLAVIGTPTTQVDAGILLQRGATVQGCEVDGTPTGIYIRYVNTTFEEIATVESNYVHNVSQKGISLQGQGLNAYANLNQIDLYGNAIGIYAGAELGLLKSFSATNNSINDFAAGGYGLIVSANIGNATQNSFQSAGGKAIASTVPGTVGMLATCNWYGTIDPDVIAQSHYSGNTQISVTPWLTDGTDTDTETIGFQPMENVCNGSPFAMSLVSQTNVEQCGGDATGAIEVEVAGETDLIWTKAEDASFTSTEKILTGLTAGHYLLTVTDVLGLVHTMDVIITEPDPIVLKTTVDPVRCYSESSGYISLSIAGGTPNTDGSYNVLWNNGSTLETLYNIPAGEYMATVTDANGCPASIADVVSEPSPITLSPTLKNVNCFSGSDGSIAITAQGGTPNYSYLWNNTQTTSEANGLVAGNYSITVTDNLGCFASANYTITQPTKLTATRVSTNVKCFGGNDGTITITATGGTAPYEYAVNNGTRQASNIIAGLSKGSYTVSVYDANNCSFTFSTISTISEPTSAVTITVGTVTKTCYGSSTGAINITVTGGTKGAGYLYNWTGPNGFTSTKSNLTGLAKGIYTVVATDANGCTKSATVEIIENLPLVISGNVVNVSCFGSSTGAINNVTVQNAVGTITYAWTSSTGFKSTAANISALKAGSYTLTVTNGGCTSSKTFVVNQPAAALAITSSKTDITGCGGLGSITINATGGTPLYKYSINNGVTYQSTSVFNGLAAGTYTLRVMDAVGCIISGTATVADNGADAFEPNQTQAAANGNILNNGTVNARIAPTNDVDWYKFTAKATAGLTYTVTLSHASVRYTFDLYDAKGKVVVPTTTVAGLTAVKTYKTLVAGAVYSLKISGSLSYICYQLTMSDGTGIVSQMNTSTTTIAAKANQVSRTLEVSTLAANVIPNPHQGDFDIQISSPVQGAGIIEMINVGGQTMLTRKVQLSVGNNTVHFSNINNGMLIYKVMVNGMQTTGKVIRMK